MEKGIEKMKLLDKITKYFFASQRYEEKNVDWRLVALDLSQQLSESEMEKQRLYQRIADLEKLLEV